MCRLARTRSPASPPSAWPVSSYTGKLRLNHCNCILHNMCLCVKFSSRPFSARLGEAVEMMSTFWAILCLFWLSWTKSKCFSWLFSTFKGRKNLSAASGCVFVCIRGFKKDHVEELLNIYMVCLCVTVSVGGLPQRCGHFQNQCDKPLLIC